MMKYLKLTALSAAAALAVLTSGCAAITGGTAQEVSLKTQKNSVEVVGANCVLKNSKGTWEVATPAKLTIHRAKDDLNVACTKDGEAPVSTTFQASTRKAALAGDIIMFGMIGGALMVHSAEAASGSAYAYPDDLSVSFGLGKDGPLNVPAPGDMAPAASTAPVQPAATAPTSTEQPAGVASTQAAILK
jgi:hypothetical protein